MPKLNSSKLPFVSIVILSWNTLEDTKTCIKYVRELDYPNFELIVVDNGSTDGSKEYLGKLENIVFINLPKNTGFTGGQIEAENVAKGDYLALINSDAVPGKDWLARLVESLESNQDAAAVGGKSYFWNEDNPRFNTDNEFYSFQIVDPVKGYARTVTFGENVQSVNSISGAGVLIRRSAIEKVGYFDNRFFAYFEETDLFARMQRAGYSIIYDPKASIWHKIAQSTKDKPYFYLYQMHKNRFLFAFKNFDREYAYRFTKIYFREWFGALRNLLAHPQTFELDSKAKVNAGLWNFIHFVPTLYSRHRVQRLGNAYSNKLVDINHEDVTVIIPNYNYANFVDQAIESVLKQTLPAFEIIVIDDGSTDDSLEVINKYKDRITIIKKHNEGVIKTKNLGIEKTQTKWILFLDADDILEPTYLKETTNVARSAGVDFVYTDMALFGKKNEYFKSHDYSKKQLTLENYIHNSALLPVDLLRRFGGYKEEMGDGYEDWELYLSVAETGAVGKRIPKPLLKYRQHEVNSRNSLAQAKSDNLYSKVYGLHPKLFNRWFFVRRSVVKLTGFNFYKPFSVFPLKRAYLTLNYYVLSKSPLTNWLHGFLKRLKRRDFSGIASKVKGRLKPKATNEER